MSELEKALRTVVQSFDKMEIRYVVMGGIAVRIHAIPRPTYDVDFIIELTRDRLQEWFAAVEDLGFTIPSQFSNGWVDEVAGMPLVKIRTYLKDGLGVDVDVFLAESDFQQMVLDRRQIAEGIDQIFTVVTPEDLLLLKLLASRPRDLIDIRDLLFMQGQLDEKYMRHWAERLGVLRQLEQILLEESDRS